jgi:hypothetical protein
MQVLEHDGCAAYVANNNTGNVTLALQDSSSTYMGVSDKPTLRHSVS